MKDIKNENGYLLYTVTESEITLDNIKVYEQRKGTGRKMIEELKDIARELQLPIGLYSYPQDNTIEQEDLNDFYYSGHFVQCKSYTALSGRAFCQAIFSSQSKQRQ